MAEIDRFGGSAHDKATLTKWATIDDYYNRRADIQMPEVATDTGSLERLFMRTNFAKTIVNSTATMAMASGLVVFDRGKRDDRLAGRFDPTEIRRLLRYASRYGASWMQVVDDKRKQYRIYKPHVARRIMQVEDSESELAVLVVQDFTNFDKNGQEREYSVARWYEWDDDRTSVQRRDFIRETDGGAWKRRPVSHNVMQRTYAYMPWVYVPNRVEDEIPEQSDLLDGIEVFKQIDALRVKHLKSLEDEAWRVIFLASVGEDVAQRLAKAGGLQVWYAKNKAAEPPPELYSVPPADLRQFLDTIKDLVNTVATVTRTSVLELNERPVQDIPAQTLRVLYGPQIERVTETVEHVNPALTEVLTLMTGKSDLRVELQPKLPISEDKIHQNLKGLLDSDAYSATRMLVDTGKTPEEAEEILQQRLREKRMFAEVETAEAIKIEEAAAAARPTPVVPR